MTKAVVVYLNRTAIVAAVWVLRNWLNQRYDSVLLITSEQDYSTDVFIDAHVYYVAEIPAGPVIRKIASVAASMHYLAKVRKKHIRALKSDNDYRPVTFHLHHELPVMEIIIEYCKPTKDLPLIVQFLSNYLRDDKEDETTYIFNAFAALENPISWIDYYNFRPEEIDHLSFAGKLMEQRHRSNIERLIQDATFKMELLGVDALMDVTVTPKYLSSSVARSLTARNGFGFVCYEHPDGYRYFEATKQEGHPLDIYAIAKKYGGIGTALYCRFKIPNNKTGVFK